MSALQNNLSKLAPILSRFETTGIQHRIAGQDVRSDLEFEDRSPVDKSLICRVAQGGAAEIDAAAQAAQAAFPA